MKKKYVEGFKITVGNSVFTLMSRINKNIWVVECSICSQDSELFPYGSISTSPSELCVNGKLPCGCAKSPRMTEMQNTILVKRECTKRGYEFSGWVDGYKGANKTQILLFDIQENIEGTVSSITSFLRGRDSLTRKDKARMAKIKTDNFYISEFMKTGKYAEGTLFQRVDKVCARGRYQFWKRFCPICSEDAYAKNGLCDGYFEGTYRDFKDGILNCRCNPSGHYLTDDQLKFKLINLSKEDGVVFLEWCDETLEESVNYKKFRWECKFGHQNNTSVSNFLKGRRCSDPVCRYRRYSETNRFGFYENRKNDEDLLYVIKLTNSNEEFIKIGRSFNFKGRKYTIAKYYDVSVIATVNGLHEQIFKLEQCLHKALSDLHYVPKIKFKGGINECFNIDCLTRDVLLKYINNTT